MSEIASEITDVLAERNKQVEDTRAFVERIMIYNKHLYSFIYKVFSSNSKTHMITKFLEGFNLGYDEDKEEMTYKGKKFTTRLQYWANTYSGYLNVDEMVSYLDEVPPKIWNALFTESIEDVVSAYEKLKSFFVECKV